MHKTSFMANPIGSWFEFASGVGSALLGVPSQPVSLPMTQRHENYDLFVPDSAASNGAPMLVMLHGAGQDPSEFAAATGMNEVADRHGFVVLYPGQSSRANAHQCWNWFEAAHQLRTQGEPAQLASLTMQIAHEHAVDVERIYVAGLSAGGAMAALLGELFPDIYAAVGVHSGVAALAGIDLSSGLAAMRGAERTARSPSGMPTICFHGEMDNIVNPINGIRVMEASFGPRELNEVRRHIGHDGRGFTRSQYVRADDVIWGEHWLVHDAGHAWSGGSKAGSYADPLGPNASAEMLRFFEQHRRALR